MKVPVIALAAALLCGSAAQAAPQAAPAALKTPRQAANIDLTGYWVSVVSEDWRWRMVTPPKQDYTSIPINAEGKRVADAWDQEKDRAGGLACKAYGAPGLMRRPGRLHITWKDEGALKVEADAGTQVRELNFGPTVPGPAEPSLQGRSTAEWATRKMEASSLSILRIPPPPPSYALKVTTTGLRPGYLRTNGVPYSERTVLTEYFDTLKYGDTTLLVITTVVDDPAYLQQPFITTTHFKREADGSKWSPTPCELTPPTRGPRPASPQ